MFLTGKPPRHLGVREGKLAPCPPTPNCVSSLCKDGRHHIAPFTFKRDPIEEMKILKEILAATSGIEVIAFQEHYLRAECKSRWFGFVDDLEMLWNPIDQVCHVRSAARLGYSDLGKNRRRVEAVRSAFETHPRR